MERSSPCYNSMLIGHLNFQDLMMMEIESHFHTAVRVDRSAFCMLVKLFAGAQAAKFCIWEGDHDPDVLGLFSF